MFAKFCLENNLAQSSKNLLHCRLHELPLALAFTRWTMGDSISKDSYQQNNNRITHTDNTVASN